MKEHNNEQEKERLESEQGSTEKEVGGEEKAEKEQDAANKASGKKRTAYIIAAAVVLVAAICAVIFLGGRLSGEEAQEPTSEEASSEHIHSHDETVSDTLYIVLDGDVSEAVTGTFSFQGGSVSPTKIAAGLTGATGWSFRINCVIESDSNIMRIDWLSDSSFVTLKEHPQLEARYEFESDEAFKKFMLDSLTATINECMEGYSIFYTVCGEPIEGLDGVSSDAPYSVGQ